MKHDSTISWLVPSNGYKPHKNTPFHQDIGQKNNDIWFYNMYGSQDKKYTRNIYL